MNSWVKLAIIVAATYFGVQYLRDGGGSGGEMPKSVIGLVHKAKTLDKKLVILITGSDWCPACQSMERSMLGTQEWLSFCGKDVIFQKYEYPRGGEASTQAHKDLLELPGFRGFPTMVVVDGKGKILDMRVGYSGGASDYISWIKSL